MSIKNAQKKVDPCKQYTNYDIGLLITAMGQLPSCINLDSGDSILTQVCKSCQVIYPTMHKLSYLHPDSDGQYEWGNPRVPVYPIGLMSRNVGGDYEAIYFYKDGDVIVVDKLVNYLFHMDG